jgi:hypothetical protein
VRRRRGRGNRAQLVNYRPPRACPLRALPVPQEPPRPQPTIDLRTQLRQVALLTRRHQPHVSLNVIVAVGRGGHDLPEHLGRKVAHDSPEIRHRHAAPVSHRTEPNREGPSRRSHTIRETQGGSHRRLRLNPKPPDLQALSKG